jgi:hypothetical protein
MLTDLEFRVWIQYLLSSDDFGVMPMSVSQLKAGNHHLENRPVKQLQRCLEALVQAGLVRQFQHQGRPYIYQHDWQKWQKVEYPRRTNNPKPSADALSACDEPTAALFAKWPGGERRKKPRDGPSDLDHVRNAHPEHIPTTRAGAPAERLTATGERLVANGSEGDTGEPSAPIDVWWFDVQNGLYPGRRVTRDLITAQAFTEAMQTFPNGPHAAWGVFQDTLSENVKSHEWRVKGMIPLLRNYITSGQWQNDPHPAEAPVADRLTPKTNRTLAAAAEVLNDRRPA